MSPSYSCAGGGSIPLSRGCYKAKFSVPAGSDFAEVRVPFKSFSDKWSPATGEQTTSCANDASVCPTAEKLKGIQRLELWAEGALGKAHLEVESISADGKSFAVQAPAAPLDLATFDGSAPHKWSTENDPVMGGQSSSTFEVRDGYGDYSGTCRIVPSLKAPGFTIALTESPLFSKFADVSSAEGIILQVRNVGSDVSLFRFAFCSSRISFKCQFQSFKADFSVAKGDAFSDVFLPWSAFSDKWDAKTGKHTAENPPTAADLKSITQLQLWTEGVEGDFHLQIKSVRAGMKPSLQGAAAAPGDLEIATFDGAAGTTFKFVELNDPVMGGKSTGSWHVDTDGHFGVFDGDVLDVPSLKAPGFIKAAADGKFPDVSSASDGELVLLVRSTTPEYKGFRVSLAAGTLSPAFACSGGGSLPLSGGCYKTKFSVPAGSDFAEVVIPFKSFSDKWSPATGEQTTTCAADSSVCLTDKELAGIKRVELWAEGALGKAHLEVKSITARKAAGRLSDVAGVPSEYNTCKQPVQPNLRYNVSSRTEPTVPVAVDPSESLADAVCCDKRTKVFAEPQFLYQAPDINLFGHLSGVTTFYDSTCGIPLFKAPVNRSMADFKADTDEHGWPSFREEEVVKENVMTDKDGFVYSKCGTHLGSYLPDEKGPRWCMDLVCLAGNPAEENIFVV
eukprot:TRINITY_DN3782_c0_g1_i4.p1 TRINITY_DN3782_c0_g1~~TRINITY_DN3782_c0_g1_i4.p1  ORF type:complete len:795 (+),score=219.57 TRINITY_DN3782_c0_g1_i4:358-2385(+)